MFSLWNNQDSDLSSKTVKSPGMTPAAVEQYRTLAVTLEQARVGPSGRVLLVTSALPREGKTLTCANLALTLSGSFRRRVLVIDGDLRRPMLHQVFGPTEPETPTEKERQAIDAAAVKMTLLPVSQNLSVLATTETSAADPVYSLGSPDMSALIARARNEFEWVLLDSPPAALVPDSNLLAQLADGVLFVIWTASTPFDAIRRGVAAVGKERIIGVVLNRTPADMADGSYEYYSRYYQSNPRALTDGQ